MKPVSRDSKTIRLYSEATGKHFRGTAVSGLHWEQRYGDSPEGKKVWSIFKGEET